MSWSLINQANCRALLLYLKILSIGEHCFLLQVICASPFTFSVYMRLQVVRFFTSGASLRKPNGWPLTSFHSYTNPTLVTANSNIYCFKVCNYLSGCFTKLTGVVTSLLNFYFSLCLLFRILQVTVHSRESQAPFQSGVQWLSLFPSSKHTVGAHPQTSAL